MSATEQLTLGELTDALTAMPSNARVALAGFSGAGSPGQLIRHRAGVDGVAIAPAYRRAENMFTVEQYLTVLRGAVGMVAPWINDHHPVTLDTPVWVSSNDPIGFHVVTGVDLVRGKVVDQLAVIRSVNTAVIEGPTVQRVSDEEATERMVLWHEARTGERIVLEPKSAQALLHMNVSGHGNRHRDLADAEHDLADYENELARLRSRVADARTSIAQNHYILGISDDLSVAAKGTP